MKFKKVFAALSVFIILISHIISRSCASDAVIAEKVSPDELRIGDKIVIVNDSYENTVSKYSAGTRLAKARVTVKSSDGKKVITSLSEEAAIFEIVAADGGDITLHCSEGYLTSAETGNGLYYTNTANEYSVWRFTDGKYLYNPNAAHTSGENTYKNNYLEYYPKSDYYSVYGKSSNSDDSYYKMSFYRLSPGADTAFSQKGYVLPVFETSDVHGYLVDTSTDNYEYRLACISDKITNVRGQNENYRKDLAILLDGGDIYQGNTISNLLNGVSLSAAYALMDYDAVTIGNHEFDWDIENTIDPDGTMIDYVSDGSTCKNSVPVTVSNIYKDGIKIDFAKDYVILEKTAVNGEGDEIAVKVAVIGFASDYSSSIMYSKFTGAGYTVSVDYNAANKLAAELEAKCVCDATILLTHAAADEAASGLGNTVIDLVLGGHTHRNICGKTSSGLTYIQPAAYGTDYAYSELVFGIDDAGSPVFEKVSAAHTVSVSADKSKLYKDEKNKEELDPAIVSISDTFIEEIYDALNDKIGYITVSALKYEDIAGSGGRSTTAGTWMSSLIARAVGADVGFMNSGGIRTEFRIAPGDTKRNITVSDVYAMFPFQNRIYVYELSYPEILTLLEYALSDSGKTLLSETAGIDCYYVGRSVKAIVLNNELIYKNGSFTLDHEGKKIKVAVNEYVATNNRESNGLSNPLCIWNGTDKLTGVYMTDCEGALEVLRKEAKGSGGLLFVDTEPHFINSATVDGEKYKQNDDKITDGAATEATEAPSDNESGDTLMTVLMITAAVLMIAAIALSVILFLKKNPRRT